MPVIPLKDRLGRVIAPGDVIRYMAGSKHDIYQFYIADPLTRELHGGQGYLFTDISTKDRLSQIVLTRDGLETLATILPAASFSLVESLKVRARSHAAERGVSPDTWLRDAMYFRWPQEPPIPTDPALAHGVHYAMYTNHIHCEECDAVQEQLLIKGDRHG